VRFSKASSFAISFYASLSYFFNILSDFSVKKFKKS